jgi:hypothetical protein
MNLKSTIAALFSFAIFNTSFGVIVASSLKNKFQYPKCQIPNKLQSPNFKYPDPLDFECWDLKFTCDLMLVFW